MAKTQIETTVCSPLRVMQHPNFARGLADIRAGRAFADEVQDDLWAYERGREYGAIAPRSMPLFDGKHISLKALRLFAVAVERGLIYDQENQARYRADYRRAANRAEA